MTSLTVQSVHQTIDDVLLRANELSKSASDSVVSWRRASKEGDDLPHAFTIEAVEMGKSVVASCACYLGYSTWDGRMLYVDHVSIEENKMKTSLAYQILAKVAVQLKCARLSWKGKVKPQWNPTHPPEFNPEWWFLEMDPAAITKFLSAAGLDTKQMAEKQRGGGDGNELLNRVLVEQVVRDCIREKRTLGKNTNESMSFRLAGPGDMKNVRHLVQQLAIYEKEPDGVNVTAEDYLLDGGSDEPLFYCILADLSEEDTTVTIGMGFFFFADCKGEGRFLYLDDLFVEEAYRGKGAGKAVMELLAHIALSLKCCKFVWTALDWNTPALQFYEKIGAKQVVDEKITRYCGEELKSFANQSKAVE